MSILGDAFKDIMPKKEQKPTESKQEMFARLEKELEESKKLWQLEQSNKPIPIKQPKQEETPVIEVSMESRFQILEHNLNVILSEIHDRLSVLEQVYLQNQIKK